MTTLSKATDSKSPDEHVQRLEPSMTDFHQEVNHHLQESWQRMEQYFQCVNKRFNELQEAIASRPTVGQDSDSRGLLGTSPNNPTTTATTTSITTASSASAAPTAVTPMIRRSADIPLRLTFPEFTPTNPRYWNRKCEQYFDVNDIDEPRKVKLARLHLNEEGDTWLYNELLQNHDLTWAQFVDNVIAEFHHLKQTGTVADYIKRFEDLKGHVLHENVSLSDKYFISYFMGGLSDSVQFLVRAHAPLTIREAMAKAKFHEAALKSIAKHPNFCSSPQSQVNSRGNKPPRETPPIKKDPTCYRCSSPWFRGHSCKPRLASDAHVLDEASSDDGDVDVNPAPNHDEQIVELSMHAINGSIGSGTLKLRGHIRHKPTLILLDTESTATFINSKMVDALHLDVLDCPEMTIALANGTKVVCSKSCPNLAWEMCGSHFRRDFRILDLGTYDIVLGTDWMKEVNPITFDFVQSTQPLRRTGRRLFLRAIVRNKRQKKELQKERQPQQRWRVVMLR
ncbi:hypothetical protein EJ110_NYTH54062 [Nymphaea thermarum]|nr:hypothetical protein EJ110_NYTH54062 [Nymphaea thermarum]